MILSNIRTYLSFSFLFLTNHYFCASQIEQSEEEKEEEKRSFVQKRRMSCSPATVDPHPQAADEMVKPAPQEDKQLSSLVVAGILDELAPREEVASLN